jgi:beta-glucanase (GH16 family)
MGAYVRARLAFAALAVVAILGIIGWDLVTSPKSVPPASAGTKVPAGAAPSASTSTPQAEDGQSGPPSGMHLVFDSDFSSGRLDAGIWNTCYAWAVQARGCTNFGNKEVEWYTPSQVTVSGGVLHLTARRESTPGYTREGAPKTYSCRSGMVTTHPGFNFEYGYIQVVAHVTNGEDLWPALWLAASNLKWPPEIDLLEHWGPPRNISAMFFHPVGADQASNHFPPTVNVTSGWHTFAVDWSASKITWYLDGKVTLSVVQEIPHQKMYFIANVAAFKWHGVSACAGTMSIRSVKVWQQ